MVFSRATIFSTLILAASGTAINRDLTSKLETRATWTSLGCYTDNVSGRALPNGQDVTGGSTKMTNEACQTTCSAAGFIYAGTEYSGECWCGNSIINGGAPASSGCDMNCNGNSAQICGGANRLSVYKSGASSTPLTTGKRGLAYNNNNPSKNAQYANLFVGQSKVTWGYDWGFPSWDLSSTFEFVPMLWGKPSGDDPAWTAAATTAGTKNVLGFNEPDLTYSESSNILPAVAAAGYKQYMEPLAGSVKIGMPGVLWNNIGSSSGGQYNSAQWTQYFMGNCTGCHFDFAAIHYYQTCSNVDWFKANVTNAYNVMKLPIWITEFQCYGTETEQITFLKTVLPWLDAQSYVARYAYFGIFPGYLINAAGNALSDLGNAFATI